MSVRVKQSLKGKVIIGTVIENDNSTIILVDENGNEIAAVLVDEEVKLTATPNDIRIGTTAVTEDGITEGEKDIPPFHTTEGMVRVAPGKSMRINLYSDKCQYTSLQVLVCKYNTSMRNSVAAVMISVDSNVYDVLSTDVKASVAVDIENTAIDLGIVNDSSEYRVIRYITYKETY